MPWAAVVSETRPRRLINQGTEIRYQPGSFADEAGV